MIQIQIYRHQEKRLVEIPIQICLLQDREGQVGEEIEKVKGQEEVVETLIVICRHQDETSLGNQDWTKCLQVGNDCFYYYCLSSANT